jgi:hypothetical protein
MQPGVLVNTQLSGIPASFALPWSTRPGLISSALFAFSLLAPTEAGASLIPNAIPGVTAFAFSQGDSADPNGTGGVNNITNGNGLTVGNPLDPSTWTHDAAWQTGWQGAGTFTVDSAGAGSALTPNAWYIADFGSSYINLDKMHIWNVREVLDRGTKNVDVFYATSPTVAPATNGSYDFASGGWTNLLTSRNLPQATGAGTDSDDIIDLTSISAARYIGLRLNSNYNSNFRVGFSEIQFTVVPEPESLGLMGVGLTLLIALRRQRS